MVHRPLVAVTLALLAAVVFPRSGEAEQSTARGKGFSLRVDAPGAVRRGVSSQFTVELIPADGRKINEDYPLKISIAAPQDVDLPRTVVGTADASRLDATRVEIPVEFMATAAGARTIVLDVRFAVCTPSACERQRQKLAFQVNAQ